MKFDSAFIAIFTIIKSKWVVNSQATKIDFTINITLSNPCKTATSGRSRYIEKDK